LSSHEKADSQVTWSKVDAGRFGAVILLSKNGKAFSIRLIQKNSVRRMNWKKEFPGCKESKGGIAYRQTRDFLHGKLRNLSFPFVLEGMTELQRKILLLCKRIPYGKTLSYSALAKRVGNPRLARIVGSTMAKNPLPIRIPCHRVIRKEGRTGGFMGDAKDKSGWKMFLLEKERKQDHFPS
jgi:O-6-methylguanine DNA methyltransferase